MNLKYPQGRFIVLQNQSGLAGSLTLFFMELQYILH